MFLFFVHLSLLSYSDTFHYSRWFVIFVNCGDSTRRSPVNKYKKVSFRICFSLDDLVKN